jgi:hypothetical protein
MRKFNPTPRALALATLATGLLTAGILVAAPQAGHGQHRMHAMGGHHMDQVDTNKDGKISKAEHDAAHARRLATLDRDKDGFVTYAEQKAAREAWKAQREAQAAERFTQRLDKDGDGRVSVAEMGSRGAGMFERMDANGDGVVTQDEMRQGHGRRARHDRDGK